MQERKNYRIRYNTAELQKYTRNSGYKLSFIAEKMGLKYSTFYPKYMGVTRFTIPQGVSFCNIVGIPLEDMPKYFE